jgi:hypothetical protein
MATRKLKLGHAQLAEHLARLTDAECAADAK